MSRPRLLPLAAIAAAGALALTGCGSTEPGTAEAQNT
jgi:hypothetical protein